MHQFLMENKHLKDTISQVKLYNDDEVPFERVFELICELKVSNLIVPAERTDNDLVFANVESQKRNLNCLPLFTSMDEFQKYLGKNSKFIPECFNFEFYTAIVNGTGLDGIIIDISGKYLFLEKEFLNEMYGEDDFIENNETGYTSQELKEIFNTVENESVVNLLKNENVDVEQLFIELSNAFMLSPLSTEVYLEPIAVDGVLDLDSNFSLCTFEDGDINYCVLFTSKKELMPVFDEDTDYYFYGQISRVTDIFDFALRSDMDGIIINPYGENVFIARENFISQANGAILIDENPKLKSAFKYAFVL